MFPQVYHWSTYKIQDGGVEMSVYCPFSSPTELVGTAPDDVYNHQGEKLGMASLMLADEASIKNQAGGVTMTDSELDVELNLYQVP